MVISFPTIIFEIEHYEYKHYIQMYYLTLTQNINILN